MPDVAVIFGGPSPEHDVSVLTGLQAARGLTGGPTGSSTTVRALFWSKTGDWYEVDPALEAESFFEGIPEGRPGSSSSPPRTVGSPTPADGSVGPGPSSSMPPWCAATAAPARTAPCRPRSTWPGSAIRARRWPVPPWGWTSWPSGRWWPAPACPRFPGCCWLPTAEPPPFPGPYIVKPRFGGSSIGIDVVEDFSTAVDRLGANPHLRHGAVIEPFRPDLSDLQMGVRTWPALEFSAVERPIRASDSAHILDYRDKYVAGEGMAGANRELPARIPSELGEGPSPDGGPDRPARRRAGGGPHRLPLRRQEFVVNEINTVPGSLARYLWVAPTVPFAELLADLLAEAQQRPTHAYSAAGADGSVLHSAGSIAGKLG